MNKIISNNRLHETILMLLEQGVTPTVANIEKLTGVKFFQLVNDKQTLSSPDRIAHVDLSYSMLGESININVHNPTVSDIDKAIENLNNMTQQAIKELEQEKVKLIAFELFNISEMNNMPENLDNSDLISNSPIAALPKKKKQKNNK